MGAFKSTPVTPPPEPEVTEEKKQQEEPYVIPDTYLGARRPIRVIVIGFGYSGINIAYVLGKQTKNANIDLQFYDKNPELGGTWYENSYPGCMCDIVS